MRITAVETIASSSGKNNDLSLLSNQLYHQLPFVGPRSNCNESGIDDNNANGSICIEWLMAHDAPQKERHAINSSLDVFHGLETNKRWHCGHCESRRLGLLLQPSSEQRCLASSISFINISPINTML